MVKLTADFQTIRSTTLQILVLEPGSTAKWFTDATGDPNAYPKHTQKNDDFKTVSFIKKCISF